MKAMTMKMVLILILIIQTVCMWLTIKDNDVIIEFSVTRWYGCEFGPSVFRILSSSSLENCVRECAVRSRCTGLNFRRRLKACELFRDYASSNQTNDENCVYIHKSDIVVRQNPCNGCDVTQACDVKTMMCVVKGDLFDFINLKCVLPNVTNGEVLGNAVAVGDAIRVLCGRGYSVQGGPATVECMHTGEWSHNVSCIQDIPITTTTATSKTRCTFRYPFLSTGSPCCADNIISSIYCQFFCIC